MAITVTSATARVTGATPRVTASITTAAGDMLVACVGSDTGSSAPAAHTVTDSGGGTWTERIHADNASITGHSGAVSIWTRAPAAGTFTVSAAGGPDQISNQVYLVTGQDTVTPIGATGRGGTNTAANTFAIFTSTVAGAAAFLSYDDWMQTGAPTSSDMTTGFTTYNVAGFVSGASGAKILGAAGAQTAQLTSPAAPDGVWAALEIHPLVGGGGGLPPGGVDDIEHARFAAMTHWRRTYPPQQRVPGLTDLVASLPGPQLDPTLAGYQSRLCATLQPATHQRLPWLRQPPPAGLGIFDVPWPPAGAGAGPLLWTTQSGLVIR